MLPNQHNLSSIFASFYSTISIHLPIKIRLATTTPSKLRSRLLEWGLKMCCKNLIGLFLMKLCQTCVARHQWLINCYMISHADTLYFSYKFMHIVHGGIFTCISNITKENCFNLKFTWFAF